MQLKVLVLDDRPRVAKESIDNSLQPITKKSDFGRGVWEIAVKDFDFTLTCDFEDQLSAARALLFDHEKPRQYHLILLDNDWGDQGGGKSVGDDGLKLLSDLTAAGIQLPYLAIYTQATGYRPEYIATALNFGARALIWKSEATHFINVLLAVANDVRLKQEISTLTAQVSHLQEKQELFIDALIRAEPRLHTQSPKMRECLLDAARYAITPGVPVILAGPTGSGKEVLARAMHAISPRKERVFEVLDCTTITAELAESVLFGHEKGAFTGAHSPRQGIFELADSGTLFIDEVDTLSLDLQRKLLRVTETGEYRRVGGSRVLHANCRLIIATNKDLHQLVAEKKFLPDLYQRLNYGALRIPSLNERREDIPALAELFLKEFSDRHAQPPLQLTDEAKAELQRHDWEFNVRALKAAVFRSALKRSADVIGKADLIF